MKRLIFTILLFGIFSAQAQESEINIDSVLTAIQKSKASTERIELNLLAVRYYIQTRDEENAIIQLDLAEGLAKKLKADSLLLASYMQRSNLYKYTGRTVESTECLLTALKLKNVLTPHSYITIHNRIAVNYMEFSEDELSIQHFSKAIEFIPAAIEETGFSYEWLYNNLGLSYTNLGMHDSALFNHLKCRTIREEKKDTLGLGQTYMNLGTSYFEMGELDSALHYFMEGLHFRKLSPRAPKSSLIESSITVGRALVALKRYGEAEKILLEQERICKEIPEFIELRHRISKELMKLYKETGKYKKAFEYAEFYYVMKDSLFDIEKREEIIRLTSKNDYEDKVLKDSLAYAEKERITKLQQEKEDEIQKQKDEANRIFQIGMGVVLVMMIGIIILVYRNYKSKKLASEQILEQKIEVEKQRDIAREQKEILAEANQEITDSINYAKRIQTSIMPSDEMVQRLLGDHFIYYQPKAIVAGDFYWVHEIGDLVYFTAADCTGHGVPGALVSVVCSNALSRSVEEFQMKKPGEILDKTRALVIEAFSKSDKLVKCKMSA